MTFFAQARMGHRTEWPWYLVALAIVFVAFVAGQIPLIAVVQYKLNNGLINLEAAQSFYDSADFEVIGMSSSLGLLLLLLSFIFALMMLFAVVRNIHGRRFGSLISPRPVRWDKIAFAAALWFILTAAGELVIYLRYPEAYHFALDWKTWIPLLGVALLILPLQTSFEELLVRGYLLQKLGIITRRPWTAIVLSSLVFGAMHLGNPEIQEFGVGIMMTYYISVAVTLAIITVLDNGLEYALGIHAATNIYGAAIVSYKGSALQTDSLVKVDAVDPILMLLMFYTTILIFIAITHFKSKLKHVSILLRPLKRRTFPATQNDIALNVENSST